MPEGGTENNTLASYDSCPNANVDDIGYMVRFSGLHFPFLQSRLANRKAYSKKGLPMYSFCLILPFGTVTLTWKHFQGDSILFTYIPKYLTNATARLQQYAPSSFVLSTNDTYAMQSMCAYETNYIGSSDFCLLFTKDEWAGFENTLEQEYYYDFSFGNPTSRAEGVGYVQEILARLKYEYITSSNSSVNSSFDNNAEQFPLDQLFFADFSHDNTIIAVLTALSLDYFHDPPTLSQIPPERSRHFILSRLTPFAARLITEVIGCNSSNPDPVLNKRTQYSPGQYGYDPVNANNKFVRMRLNNGILPLVRTVQA